MPVRFLIVFIIMLFALPVFSNPAYAKKSFWDVILAPWLDEIDTGPKPEETLQAPFAYDRYKKNTLEDVSSSAIASLKTPHVDGRTIDRWLTTAVSLSLSHEPVDAASARKDDYKPYFTKAGLAQLQRFKDDNGVQKAMNSDKHIVRTVVTEKPFLLNSLEHAGKYKWLFEVPVMVSVFNAGDFDYEKNTPVNQSAILRVQVTRVDVDDNSAGLMIELFQGSVETADSAE